MGDQGKDVAMRSTSRPHFSAFLAEKKGSITVIGIVLAATVALLLGDGQSIGMTHN
jgi:hypothetical protein